MIVKIDKPIVLKYDDRKIELPKDLQSKIDDFWENAVKENPSLYNGEDYTVESIEETEKEIILHIVKTYYSHYLYDERIGIEDEKYRCISPWGGIILLTKDNYWVVGEMCEKTSFPKGFQISGGGIEKNDIKLDIIDISKNIKRELKEEMNLNLDEIDYEIKYRELPSKKRNAYGLIAIGKVDKTKDEMEEHFENYNQYLIENKLELEFEKLVFLKKGSAVKQLDEFQNPKRVYLRDLLERVDFGNGDGSDFHKR